MMKSEKERLLSKIKINPITGCWEWQGTKRRGYGRITVGSRKDGTRRTFYTIIIPSKHPQTVFPVI